MRASILRSIETVLKRTSSSSLSQSPSQSHLIRRSFASESSHRQPLASLMKLNPLDSKFSLYDIAGTPGVAADVSHINTRSEAVINMISNPVNSTVPIAAEVFKKAGTYDEKKLFGVTTLDFVRARTFYAGKAGVNVADVDVPVVGGHAGITILPPFSQATPRGSNFSDEEITAFSKRIQDGGTDVVEAKAGKGFATLSMAYAGAVFANAYLNELNGVSDIVECSYMQSTITGLPFFASKVRLGKNGVEKGVFFSLLYRPAAFILQLNSLFFKHRNEGIREILADYVHQEMTRTLFLVFLRLFLLIGIKDVFLSLVF